MTRKPLIYALLIAITLAVAVIARKRLEHSEASMTPSVGEQAITAAGDAGDGEVGAVNRSATAKDAADGDRTFATTPVQSNDVIPLPLPPADSLVADVFDELLQRARRGDARAACRLASDLQRCRSRMQARMPPPAEIERRIASEQNSNRRESMIDYIARAEAEQERNSKVCTGLDDSHFEHAFALQMQAAREQPELRMWAVINPALDTRFFVDDLEQWTEYRRVAMPWLEAAAAEGDIAAILALARIHGDDRAARPNNPPISQLDGARFLVYAGLLDRYGYMVPPVVAAADAMRQTLDAAALAETTARIDALYDPTKVRTLSNEERAAEMRRSFMQPAEQTQCE